MIKASCLVLAAFLLVTAGFVRAQQPAKVPRVGYLSALSSTAIAVRTEAFRQGLRKLGYVDGQNIAIEYRYADGDLGRVGFLATELVQLKVDVIVAAGGDSVATSAKNATTTTPIIMTNPADPVTSKLIASLARPGGNVTGLSAMSFDLSGKRLELLKETVPKATRIAVLYNPLDPTKIAEVKEIQPTAHSLAVQLQMLEVRSSEDFENVFQAAVRARTGAVLVLPTALTNTNRQRIATLATSHRLPAMNPDAEFVDAGG